MDSIGDNLDSRIKLAQYQHQKTLKLLRLQQALIVRLVLRVNWWRVLEEVEVSSIARDDSEWLM